MERNIYPSVIIRAREAIHENAKLLIYVCPKTRDSLTPILALITSYLQKAMKMLSYFSKYFLHKDLRMSKSGQKFVVLRSSLLHKAGSHRRYYRTFVRNNRATAKNNKPNSPKNSNKFDFYVS